MADCTGMGIKGALKAVSLGYSTSDSVAFGFSVEQRAPYIALKQTGPAAR